jgi:hypothetical protein
MKYTAIKKGDGNYLVTVLGKTTLSGIIPPDKLTEFKDAIILEDELAIKKLFLKPEGVKFKVDYTDFIARLKEWNHPFLEFKNNRLMYKGINLAIPEFLCEKMAEASYEELTPLCNFWRNLALCPEPNVREDLFEYLNNNGFIITNQGLIVSLRRAHKVKEGAEQEENTFNDLFDSFVSRKYTARKLAKKGTKNVYVADGDEGFGLTDNIDEACVSESLYDLYHKLINKKQETAEYQSEYYVANNTAYTHFTIDGTPKSGRVEYHLLKETRISRQDCDHDSSRHCSNGLHNGTPEYVLDNSWLGESILVCLTNPMDVVSVPTDGYHKFRTSALYPLAEITTDEVEIFTQNQGTVIFDEEYMNYTTEYIESLLETSEFQSLKDDFILPRELTVSDVQDILKDIRKIINSRY